MKRIALVPAFQPDELIFPLLEELHSNDFDIVVVNDGSDISYNVIFDKIPEYVHILSYEINKGKGHALKYGLTYIRDTYKDDDYVVITLDSDGQHKVKDGIRVIDKAIENPHSLVIGSRFLDKSAPFKSRMGNFFARTSFLLFTKTKIYDTQTGLRAIGKDLIDEFINVEGERYEYEMNMLLYCTKNNIRIIEEKIETIYLDKNSRSHYNPFKDTFRIFKEIIKFSASSLIGFLVDYALFSLLVLLPFEFNYKVLMCNILARIVSASVNFTLNYKFVFKSKDRWWKSAIKYFLLATFILGCNTGLLYLLVDKAGMNQFLAKFLVEVTLFIISWLIQRLFVFRKKKNAKEN